MNDSFHGEELPAKSTPLTPDDAAKAISDGYKIQTGAKPSKKVLALLVAQSAHETGDWKKLSNFNMAGVKASAGDLFFQKLRCFEVVNGETVWYEAGSPQCIFAAYKTAADGAARYIATLQKREHWWTGLHTGSVDGYIAGLTTAPYKYFTGDKEIYRKRLNDKIVEYEAVIKKYSASIIGGILITGLLGLGGYLGYRKFKNG